MPTTHPRHTQLRAKAVLILLCLIGLAATFSFAPLEQDVRYHDFADGRRFFGVPHFLNVASNAPFFYVGALGLSFVLRGGRALEWLASFERTLFLLLFLGALLTGIGSSYYHAWPSNETLVWDRLPLTLVFTCFFTAVVTDRFGPRAGNLCFVPLVVLGASSVVYWYGTELAGAGDLRPYYFVQFFPMLAIPLMVLLSPPRYSYGADLIWILGWYGLAKVSEVLDATIFDLNGIVSGHTLKHLLAGVALWRIFLWLRRRRPLTAGNEV